MRNLKNASLTELRFRIGQLEVQMKEEYRHPYKYLNELDAIWEEIERRCSNYIPENK